MKYKGYLITPAYTPGSDFRVLLNGTTKSRKPTTDDIAYYYIEHIETGDTLVNEFTIREAKDSIDQMIAIEELNNEATI